MNSITRTLCQKYTNLTDDEITHIESYSDMLQALANAEQADVFIDCRSLTGKTAIVVGEAKPQTVPSNYSIPILGMLINWKDEPAVDRTFRFGKSTKKMCAVHMPEDRKVVQTVEPIFYNDKLIAVLIFERNAETVKSDGPELPDIEESLLGHESRIIIEHLSEAVLLIGNNDEVIACNAAAKQLYSEKLGYIDSIIGMPLKNIQPDSDEHFLPQGESESGIRSREETVSNLHLRYTTIPINEINTKYAVIIDDVTDLRSQEEMSNSQSIALREQRHRIKNSLIMLSGMLKNQEEYSDELDAGVVLHDTQMRINAIAAALDEIVHVSDKTASLKYVLEKVRANALQSSVNTLQPITIKIECEDQDIKPAYTSPIALVTNELIQNALKHAFPAGRCGTIVITSRKDVLSTRITVCDDGVGFKNDGNQNRGTGLKIIETIVNDRLNGEFHIESDGNGTIAYFDFI